jgi:hypothetical protein
MKDPDEDEEEAKYAKLKESDTDFEVKDGSREEALGGSWKKDRTQDRDGEH